jgi:hypothetical protein
MTIGYRDRCRSEVLSRFHAKAQRFGKGAKKGAILCDFAEPLRLCVKLVTRPEQPAEDALHTNLAGWNCEWLKL